MAKSPALVWTGSVLVPEPPVQRALRRWRDHWPWREHTQPLPALAPQGYGVQCFVRLDCEHGWNGYITLNGQAVCVPIADDPQTERVVAMLPVPTPHVTVRYHDQGLIADHPAAVTIPVHAWWIEVTTEGGA